MVHRQLIRGRLRAAALSGLALALALLVAPSAWGANRRVAISHYQWSRPQIQLDLGEHVTWYWVGPDTMHSVTGSSANDAGLDSDPGKATPRHSIGDSFQLTFNTPGTYDFQCKLHPTVRGTVHVSSVPGDPTTEVDPVPKSHVDLTAPYVDGLSLRSSTFARQRNRAALRNRRARDRRRRVLPPSVATASKARPHAAGSPAGNSGTPTSATTTPGSPTAAGTSARFRAATSPRFASPTRATTPLARDTSTSRSADSGGPRQRSRRGGRGIAEPPVAFRIAACVIVITQATIQ